MFEEAYALADPDYYEPVEALGEPGRRFAPAEVPDGWRHVDRELWREWRRPGQQSADQGWKVHVSARADRVAAVFDVFAQECFERDIPFRHVAAERFVMLLQHEHAPRAQSGKLFTAYPVDESAAAGLMAALSGRLADEEGQYILTDRRYGDSKVVHYRYGAFATAARLLPDGTTVPVLRDGRDELVPESGEARFRLPAGIVDPFVRPGTSGGGDGRRGEFVFERAIRHGNGGGAYVGRQVDTGRKVFIKEARDHAGLSWDGRTSVERLRDERRISEDLHAALPGLAPEPIAYFRDWEHEFLATEFVSGVTLNSWVVRHFPLIHFGAFLDTFDSYLADCESIISVLEEQLHALHTAGFDVGDVSRLNVILDAQRRPRIVGFDTARPVSSDFGISELVRFMLGPTLDVPTRYPRSMAHLKADLEEYAAIPPALWKRAVRHLQHDADSPELLPDPDAVAADPERHVRELRDKVAHALIGMGDAANPHRIYPSVPDGYATNTECVAFGTAGVLHALRQCGMPVVSTIVERFRRDALAKAATLAPSLHAGLAGIAWTLAEYGFLTEARDLLARATDHPLTRENASLAHGAAGVALTHLSLFERTGDYEHVDAARRLVDAVPADEDLLAALGRDDPSGWLYGRCGIAWTLLPLGAVSGEDSYLERGVRMLHYELDRATHPGNSTLQFLVSSKDRRAMPYLYCGTAGMLRTITRYNRVIQDERLQAAEDLLLPRLRTPYTVRPGLYQGIAGLGFTLAEHGALTGDDAYRGAALRTARALFKYAVPGPAGVRFHGEQAKRFSADLFSGSAGILLFLDEVLRPRRDRLFSLDELTADHERAVR